jgi:hypothetical protein
MPNPIEQLKAEYDSLVDYLTNTRQPSLLSDLNKNYRKVLLLSAGSFFEHQITSILCNFVRTASNGDDRIVNFLEKQAISQRYHTLFTWGEKDNPGKPNKNAATFLRLFGDAFKSKVEAELTGKPNETQEEKTYRLTIKSSIEAFVEIGHLRNILVHSNFAAYVYDQKTTDEIYDLFCTAQPFLQYLTEKLK